VNVANTTADTALTLVSGIKSNDVYFKHFAYAELQQFASDESATGSSKRSALFADQKYNPSLWSTLVREALLALGQDYQLFLRRGAPPAAGKSKLSLHYIRCLFCCKLRHLLRHLRKRSMHLLRYQKPPLFALRYSSRVNRHHYDLRLTLWRQTE
jgi:hypothetical protein